ncbi:MAG: hypothetical protein Pg6B_01490 [Candidatus Azobacteroides pseudotrichonymphae]|jgi:hypothetical protein|nr:MAG: hypothetical protein Pg6B_01490 [Candidatus Azobacteroides pseudotrichonymphae]
MKEDVYGDIIRIGDIGDMYWHTVNTRGRIHSLKR